MEKQHPLNDLMSVAADKLRAYAEKGQNRVVRVMILGVPNVGKSTFINRIAGRKTAKTEDRPGVTRSKQWVPIDRNLELLDTPGILWPKFEDQSVGLNLAYTGAVKDDILDVETLGCHLMTYLGTHYPEALTAAYKLPGIPEREAEENPVCAAISVTDRSVFFRRSSACAIRTRARYCIGVQPSVRRKERMR